jgi:hypothetical protein
LKKPLTAVLLIAGALATMAVPAGAAVPNRTPKFTVTCRDKPGKAARVWWRWKKPPTPYASGITEYAADNPCGEWLVIPYGGFYASSAAENVLDVAPGVHFNWGKKQLASFHLGLSSSTWATFSGTDTPGCDAPTSVHLVDSYKDVRSPPGC